MYVFDLLDVARFDPRNARRFVDFWSKFYSDTVRILNSEELINYYAELNLTNNLTEENVVRLLRWKDPFLLTHPSGASSNEPRDNRRVVKVLAKLGSINQFRNNQSSEADMKRAAQEVFQDGIVWRAFLLHIAKPPMYPIADQNVFRACSLHTGLQRDNQTWDTYESYCNYFQQITESVGVDRTVANVTELKRIDNALFEFGKSLNTYDRALKSASAASAAN